MNIQSRKSLGNGEEIPVLGLGVYLSPEGETTAASVRWAVEAGYRHIDTAAVYGNEASVGEGIRTCGMPREQLFVTSKLWNDDIRKGRELEAFRESLKKLGTEYLDLYLIHWPVEGFMKSWHILEDLYRNGAVRAIGVSNFHKQHLEMLEAEAEIMPMVNQFECHPYLSQEMLIETSRKYGMVCEAYSPLGGQNGPVLSDPVICKLAREKGCTAAQIVLQWNVHRGLVVLPKSNHRERIESNARLFDVELSQEEIQQIDSLNCGMRTGGDPDHFDF